MGGCLSKKKPQSKPAVEPNEERPLESEPQGPHEDKEQKKIESEHEHSPTKPVESDEHSPTKPAKSDSKSSSSYYTSTKSSDSKSTATAAPSNHQVDPAISPSLEAKHPAHVPPSYLHPKLLQSVHPTLTPIPGSPCETQPSPDELCKTSKTKMAEQDKEEGEVAKTEEPSQTKSDTLKKFFNIGALMTRSKTSQDSDQSKPSDTKSIKSIKSTKSTKSNVETKSKHDGSKGHEQHPPKEHSEHEAPSKEHEVPGGEREGHKDPCKDFDPNKYHPDPCRDHAHVNGRRYESHRFKAAAKNAENEHEMKAPLDKSLFMRGRFDPVGGSGLCSDSRPGHAGRNNGQFICPDIHTENGRFDSDDEDVDWKPKTFRRNLCSPSIGLYPSILESECKGYNPELTVASGADRFKLMREARNAGSHYTGSNHAGSHHHPTSHTNSGPSRSSMTPVSSIH